MSNPDHLGLKIRTLQASNRRLRKHIREGRRSPPSGSLFTSPSENIVGSQVQESSLSLDGLLQQGVSYIVTRYQEDIRKINEFAQGKISLNCVFPLVSDSSRALQRLVNSINGIKLGKADRTTNSEGNTLVQLVGNYQEVRVENENRLRVILDMEEVIQRMDFQNKIDQANFKVVKHMASGFADSIYLSTKLNSINKLRAAVTAIQFSFRLLKVQINTEDKVKSCNARLIQPTLLFRQLYKSYANGFQYIQNETTIKRLLSKDPGRSLTRLLNLDTFHQKPSLRGTQLKLDSLGKLAKYPQLYQKMLGKIQQLQNQVADCQKAHQLELVRHSSMLQKYKALLQQPRTKSRKTKLAKPNKPK